MHEWITDLLIPNNNLQRHNLRKGDIVEYAKTLNFRPINDYDRGIFSNRKDENTQRRAEQYPVYDLYKAENHNKEACEMNRKCDSYLIARSGCCSWHGGVCGCDEASDRIICCDQTYSPTCKCSTY